VGIEGASVLEGAGVIIAEVFDGGDKRLPMFTPTTSAANTARHITNR